MIYPAVAQDFPGLQFDHITIKDGLSSNYVTCYAEDKLGFIWVGTSNGLNRYDGYRFKHFFHSTSDEHSLINNSIQKIYCDTRGRLWICTEDGVSCYIPAENRFVNYSTVFKPPFHLKNGSSVRIYEDEQQQIWICNQREVLFRVKADMTLDEHPLQQKAFSIGVNTVSGYDFIFRDSKDTEWAIAYNRVYRLNKSTKQVAAVNDFSAQCKGPILRMFEDSRGNYWFCTWGSGVFRFYPEKGEVQVLKELLEKNAAENIFTSIDEWTYKKKKYMVTVESQKGLYLVDETTAGSKLYKPVLGDESSIEGLNLNDVFEDSKGNLWVSTIGGVNLVKTGQGPFDIVPVTDPGTSNYFNERNGIVYSYFETESSIWLSKIYISTFELDKSFRVKNFFRSLCPLSATTVHHNGYAFYFFRNGDELFISTDSGLVVYSLRDKTAKEYFPDGDYTGGLGFRTIIPFGDSSIMLRTVQQGLFVFNLYTKKFRAGYSSGGTCSDCLPVRLAYLYRTKKGEIFVTSEQGSKNFFRYDPAADKFQPVLNGGSLSPRSGLFGMDEDKDGNLWIAGRSGICIYSPAKNKFIQYLPGINETGGLFRICFDLYGNAWANGNSGIWCYNTASGRWIHFDAEDGLPGSSYEGVITTRSNGEVVAGVEGAAVIFHPDIIFSGNKEVPVYITEATAGNNFFSFTGDSKNKELVVRPGDKSFSVDFAILNYTSSASSRYYYKLEPSMKDFQVNDNGHINFNSLPPGTYTLQVRGGDKVGNIFQREDRLKIIVQPGWYQTAWFKLLVLLLVAAGVFFFIRWRTGIVRKEASYRQKIAETEMQALRAQMNPHFIFNSLNSIENFIMQNEKRLASDYLNKFARLIRMILDSSRNELVPLSKDMEALQLYIDLEQLRFDNKFRYQATADPALINGDYKVPSLLIQPYVENAIVHGLAHSERTDLLLTVSVSLEEDQVRYVVQDNGVGREMAAAYNQQNKPQHKSVGMKITEERVNLFNKYEAGRKSIKITDLYNEKGEPAGTRTEVLIKAF